ncbi:winged helix DNA-binding domain-containing protein [Nocardia higoensis]|uniref:winged helix DNA-binding domain-containing protein n=1 Tax=Nocardia higoensis TaxID=228599 RepID=UPI0002EE0DAF|nr:winged helix DNA-binding domain-containing protein [Nocardia higoensis]
MRVTWDQVFAWRLRRQFVAEPVAGEGAAVAVADRLSGVQAQVASAAETAVAVRSTRPVAGAVESALASGALVKTWAMRGTLHAMTPATAAAVLPLIASARTWEKPSWQKTFGASPETVAALAEAVGRILAGAVLTRAELVDALLADSGFHDLGTELKSGWGALLKPLAWQGVLCHGPAEGNRVTFTSPHALIPGWSDPVAPEIAAPVAIRGYLGAYGPAGPEVFDAWLTRNSLRKTVVRSWFTALGDALTPVEVEGRAAYLLTEHAGELAAVEPSREVHLLGPFDQYVLGPGTADTELLPKAHRGGVSRTAGWIAPLVVDAGRITGTWEFDGDEVIVSMFGDAPLPKGFDDALERLARATGRADLRVGAR